MRDPNHKVSLGKRLVGLAATLFGRHPKRTREEEAATASKLERQSSQLGGYRLVNIMVPGGCHGMKLHRRLKERAAHKRNEAVAAAMRSEPRYRCSKPAPPVSRESLLELAESRRLARNKAKKERQRRAGKGRVTRARFRRARKLERSLANPTAGHFHNG